MIQTIIFDRDKGGHFLDWSVYFVSGKTNYFHCSSRQDYLVVDNPLNGLNSHVHKSNFASTVNELDKIYSYENCNVIFHQMRKGLSDSNFDPSGKATTDAINLAKQKSDKIILLKNHKDFALYDFSLHRRYKQQVVNKQGATVSDKDFFNNFVDTFFHSSRTKWDNAGNFVDIWDKREFVALNFRPFEKDCIESYHKFDFDHYLLDTKQLWSDFNIRNLLDYLSLPCEQQKLDKWYLIYSQWIELHKQKIDFCINFEEIIDGIIENRNIDLLHFKLDLLQEAAIQHNLMYSHNLNLKTWQLKKFENTSQLHNLLEGNIHKI